LSASWGAAPCSSGRPSSHFSDSQRDSAQRRVGEKEFLGREVAPRKVALGKIWLREGKSFFTEVAKRRLTQSWSH